MTQKDVYGKFKNSPKHLIDITGCGNWYGRCHPELTENLQLPGVTDKVIDSLRYCPFCGVLLENNVAEEEEPNGRYIVWHHGQYYSDETIPDEWYWQGYTRWEDAYQEYQSLISIGLPEDDIYIRDTQYDIIFEYGEWV